MKTEESVVGAGQKKVERPAPQIATVRPTMAKDPLATTLLGLFSGFLIQLIWSRAIQGAGMAQVRKSRGDRRRKSTLYDLQWRRTPSQNLTGAILRQTGTVNPPRQDWDSVQSPVAKGGKGGIAPPLLKKQRKM